MGELTAFREAVGRLVQPRRERASGVGSHQRTRPVRIGEPVSQEQDVGGHGGDGVAHRRHRRTVKQQIHTDHALVKICDSGQRTEAARPFLGIGDINVHPVHSERPPGGFILADDPKHRDRLDRQKWKKPCPETATRPENDCQGVSSHVALWCHSSA